VLDLVVLVRSTLNDQRRDIESHGLTLHLEAPAEPVWVLADSTRLEQALANLLTNAGKFTDSGGVISVRVAADADQTRVSVRDTGVGMSAEMLGRVFEPFSQEDQSLDRSRGGLGLGLSLVRGLMELHGGSVQVASEGPGAGCEFTLALPRTAAPSTTTQEVPSRPASGSMRVLVIDDGRDTVITMRALLRKLGHEVAVAHDGEQGLEVAREFQPEVVFSDIGLPGIDGYEVARRLRQDARFRNTHLVAVTGYGQREDQQHAHDAGFDEHLTKPVAFAALARSLAAVANV
jgi:CheY-like chemotaxis protein/anti-sigma regulatory factor (Ser/Thr protein kinase)